MTPSARAAAYLRQTGAPMTPRQQRRYRRKVFASLPPRFITDRLPGSPLSDPADGARPSGISAAPAPTPTSHPAAGVGVTPATERTMT